MLLLAIDTTTAACSVALARSGELVAEVTTVIPRSHSQRLLPLVDGLFQETPCSIADVDALAVSRGPGSFTGLRIGLATVRGLALALDKPVTGVCTLEVLAHGAGARGLICPVLNARREQVYTALYRADGAEPQTVMPGQAMAVSSLINKLRQWREPVWFCGDGTNLVYEGARKELADARRVAPHHRCNRASALADLAFYIARRGELIDADKLTPLYLRESQAEIQLRQKEGPADGR